MADVIELKANNLYGNGTVYGYADGEQELVRERLIITPDERDKYYTVLQDDRLDLITYNQYSKYVEDASKYWWVIADANEAIENPLDLSALVGQEILIPYFFRAEIQAYENTVL